MTPMRAGAPAGTRVVSIDVGRKNLALCLVRAGEEPSADRVEQWTVTACEPSSAGMRDALESLAWATECDEVVIERQPPSNPTMCRLQHYIEMFYAMHRKPVTVQDAKHKLAYAASTPWWPPGAVEGWNYRIRKKLSVAVAAAFVAATAQDQGVAAAFQGSAKKDDFADSLLQGQAYCHGAARAAIRVVAPPPTAPKHAKKAKTKARVIDIEDPDDEL